MADASETIRQGEIRPFYGEAEAESGTLTIQGQPTATLYDSSGEAVSGYPVNATGATADAAATVQAWLTLETADLDPGLYTLVFSFEALGSDGITRTYQPSVEITVSGPVLDAGVRSTLLPLLRKLRRLIGDTETGDCRVFADDELQDALDEHRQDVRNLPLCPEPTLGSPVQYLHFQAELDNWEADAVLQDAHYATVTPTTSDYQRGRFAFATEPEYPLVISGKSFDLYGAAADLCEQWAAKVKLDFTFSPGSGNYTRAQKHQMLLRQAETYRAKQRPFSVGQVRSDIGHGGGMRSPYDRILRR